MFKGSEITVLFVDDESDILSSINRFLRKESYNKLFADSGIKALELIKKNNISILVSDLRMPEMNGLELLNEVKKNNSDIVRLILSGSHDIDPIIESINTGEVFRFIPKPVDPLAFKRILNDSIEYYCLKTEREKLFNALSIKNQELTTANNTLNVLTKKLQQSEDELRSMTDAAHDAVLMLNNDGEIIYRNTAAENLFGFSREKYCKQNFLQLISPESDLRNFDVNDICKLPSVGVPDFEENLVHQIEGLRKDGTSVPLEISKGCVQINDIPHTVIIARNITARVEAERSKLHFEDMQKEIESEIEKKLLQSPVPKTLQGAEISRMMIPSGHLDGDFTDFIIFDSHHADILIGDVMGHGIHSALVGVGIKSLFLKVHAQKKHPHIDVPALQDIVTGVHELCINELMELGTFATLLFIRLNLESGILSVVDCGHPPVIHFHADTGTCSILKGDNLPIGLIEHQEYRAISYPIKENDILCLFSDGITECCSPDNTMFGDEQLVELISKNHALPPQALIEHIKEAVTLFSCRETFDDDLSCIVIRVGSAGKEQ
ncbi:MAG: SpoIIE family protein phosphatase [Chlorobiales bacterium]|nr:SpoIIE family protein phosphatase [Chlorobiales bacterium]